MPSESDGEMEIERKAGSTRIEPQQITTPRCAARSPVDLREPLVLKPQ